MSFHEGMAMAAMAEQKQEDAARKAVRVHARLIDLEVLFAAVKEMLKADVPPASVLEFIQRAEGGLTSLGLRP